MRAKLTAILWALFAAAAVENDACAYPKGLDPRVARFLAAPARPLAKTPKGFRIIVLSNLAEYCANLAIAGDATNDQAKRCLARLVELARGRDVSPLGDPATAALGAHGLYLSHLGIVLGAYQRIAGDGRHRALNQRIAEHLARGMNASANAHLASYPDTTPRWPADQTATLYALHLYDENFGASISAEPIRRWSAWVAAHAIDPATGLPESEITGATSSSKLPRGCALSFSVRYLAAFAPDDARALWKAYKASFEAGYGPIYGFREWPRGAEHAADADSGPVIMGIGTAASGFAIGAARAVGDEATYARLTASAAIAKKIVPDLGILAVAIELAGRSITPSYSPRT